MAKTPAERQREYRERKRKGEVLDVRSVLRSHEKRIRALEDGVAVRATPKASGPGALGLTAPDSVERPGPHQPLPREPRPVYDLQSQIDAVPNRLTPEQVQEYLRRNQ